MGDEPFYTPNRRPAPPRQPKPGEEVWRLRHQDGRVQHCELRHNDQVGAGRDVMLLEDGELLFSRLCGSEALAQFAAEAVRQDLVRTGWKSSD